jgi:DNA-binding NarL/FixJ family response regulator
MFKFITDTAKAAVDLTCDTALSVIGEGDGPKREDVAQLLAAGMTVGAIALALGVAEEWVEAIAQEGDK